MNNLKKPSKLFYAIIIVISSFFLTVIFFPEQCEKIPKKIYKILLTPAAKVCLFQKSKLACLIRVEDQPINPNCFINDDLLQSKIRQGLPKWVNDQIEEDLSKFPVISKKDLERYFKEDSEPNNMLAKIKIKDKKVTIIHATSCSLVQNTIGYKHAEGVIQHVLEYLATKNHIPDTEFIISLADFYKPVGQISIPVFAFCKDLDIPVERDLILIPDWQNLGSASDLRKRIRTANKGISWDEKKDVLFWRGGESDSTGFRHRFMSFFKENPLLIDAAFISVFDPENKNVFVAPEEHLKYKYLISIDGFRGSWERLIWHLHSNSLVFKHQSNQIQWFYKGIKPFVHYLPVADENAILQNIAWAETHPREVQSIIQNASQLVEDNLSLEDMYHYIAVLLQEYHKRLID